MITERDKQQLTHWLSMNLQIVSKSNVELIVSHIDRYFQSPQAGLEMYNAWPLKDVLNKLIHAANILLHKKDYDGHDHEEIAICVKRAEEIKNKTQLIPDSNQDELWLEIGTRIMDGYDNMDKQGDVTKELSSKYIIAKR